MSQPKEITQEAKERLLAAWGYVQKRQLFSEADLQIIGEWKDWKKTIDDTDISNFISNFYKPDEKCLVNFVANAKPFGGIGGMPRPSNLFGGSKTLTTKSTYEEKLKSDYGLFKNFLEKPTSALDSLLWDKDNNKFKYSARALLRKVVVMDHYANQKFDLAGIYKPKAIKTLYKLFFGEKCDGDKDFFERNHEIFEEAKKTILPDWGNEKDLLTFSVYLTLALWQLAQIIEDFPTAKSPNVIFYGAPGTGKTYEVKQFLGMNGFIDIDIDKSEEGKQPKGYYKWVQLHPSFSYEDFIEGVKPTDIENGQVKLELVNGVFKEFCKKAREGVKDSPEKDILYYFVVDEINRANLSAIFGETLSLIESDYRDMKDGVDDHKNLIDTQYSALERKLGKSEIFYDEKFPGKFGVPRNVFFIGMMNDVDRSIDTFDLALRRRFRWVRKECDYDVIGGDYAESCKKLNEYISKDLRLGKSYEFGHSFFMRIATNGKVTKTAKERLFDDYLRPTLAEYLRSAISEENELELKLNEAKKIFSKVP